MNEKIMRKITLALLLFDDKGMETEMKIDTLNKKRMVIREENGILILVK